MARVARLIVMMVRPPVIVAIFMFAALGMAQAGRADGLHPLFTLVPVVVAGWFVHATVLNDLSDEAIDRVNLGKARGRPLVSGDATRAELLRLGRAAGCVAVGGALLLGWRVAAVVAVGLALNAAYSRRPLRICDRGAVATFLLPAGYVALPYLVGALAVEPALGRQDVVVLVGLYVAFAGRILLKDFRDVRGDELFGKRTFLLRHGPVPTCLMSAVCWLAGTLCLLAVAPWRSLLVSAFALYVACAWHGLYRLARPSGFVAQQVIIGAIAQSGRGMGVTLLAHLTMHDKGWPATAQAVVTVTLALLYVGMYAATLAERDQLLAIRPY